MINKIVRMLSLLRKGRCGWLYEKAGAAAWKIEILAGSWESKVSKDVAGWVGVSMIRRQVPTASGPPRTDSSFGEPDAVGKFFAESIYGQHHLSRRAMGR
jgi:hypothetical protein